MSDARQSASKTTLFWRYVLIASLVLYILGGALPLIALIATNGTNGTP